MSQFQSNKFYFVFSSDDIKRIDDHFSAFKYKAMRCELSYENIEVNSRKDFVSLINRIESECKLSGVKPFIHFECHGSEIGLLLKSKARIFWNDLANYLTKINIACKNHLFVTFSTCYGGHLTFPLISKITQKIQCQAPVFGLIGPMAEISYGEIRDGYDEFFVSIINKSSIDAGIEKLSNRLNNSTGMIIITCEEILKKLFDVYLSMESGRKFKNNIQFNAWLTEQNRNYFFKTGRIMSREDLELLAKIGRSKDFYLDYFKKLHRKFLMLDLYPENTNRFSSINDINNWDVLTANIL